MEASKESNNSTLTGISGTVYTVNFSSTNAACRLEDAVGKSYGEIMDDLRGPHPTVSGIRQFVKAGVIEPKDLTLDAAGDLIDDVGGWAMFLGTINPKSPQAELVKEFLRLAAEAETALKSAPVDVGTVEGITH